jgi:hypothetical protein
MHADKRMVVVAKEVPVGRRVSLIGVIQSFLQQY